MVANSKMSEVNASSHSGNFRVFIILELPHFSLGTALEEFQNIEQSVKVEEHRYRIFGSNDIRSIRAWRDEQRSPDAVTPQPCLGQSRGYSTNVHGGANHNRLRMSNQRRDVNGAAKSLLASSRLGNRECRAFLQLLKRHKRPRM
jgi:hypothetical protein